MLAWIKVLGCAMLLGVCGYVLHAIAEWDGRTWNGQDIDKIENDNNTKNGRP